MGLAGYADEVLLAIALNIARARICIVAGDSGENVVEREAESRHGCRVGQDMDFFLEPADRVDLGHALDGAQLRQHDPVIQCPQVHRGPGRAVLLHSARFRREDIHVNLAKARRNRTRLRRNPVR